MKNKEKILIKIISEIADKSVVEKIEDLINNDEQENNITDESFMSEERTLKYCGDITRSTLWNWRKAGLKSYRVGGRRLYLKEDVKNFIVSEVFVK